MPTEGRDIIIGASNAALVIGPSIPGRHAAVVHITESAHDYQYLVAWIPHTSIPVINPITGHVLFHIGDYLVGLIAVGPPILGGAFGLIQYGLCQYRKLRYVWRMGQFVAGLWRTS